MESIIEAEVSVIDRMKLDNRPLLELWIIVWWTNKGRHYRVFDSLEELRGWNNGRILHVKEPLR